MSPGGWLLRPVPRAEGQERVLVLGGSPLGLKQVGRRGGRGGAREGRKEGRRDGGTQSCTEKLPFSSHSMGHRCIIGGGSHSIQQQGSTRAY